MKTAIRWAIVMCVLGIVSFATAQVPEFINYQGRLLRQDGTPMVNDPTNAADGQIDLAFRIYDASANGNLVWSNEHANVAVQNGLFSVLLGGLNESHFPTNALVARWLEVEVRAGAVTNTLWPRKEIVSVAYAMRAGDADMVDGKHASELGGLTNEVDPMVTNWVKNGVTWAEIKDIAGDMPEGFKDGIDDVGVTNWVQLITNGMPVGFADGEDNMGITNWVELKAYGMPAGFTDDVDNVGITVEMDPQVDDAMANNSVPRWNGAITQLVTGSIYYDPNTENVGIGITNPAFKLDVDGSGNINGPLSVRGILRVTETNIIEVMGTNIITNWPHASMVGNLNADMVDGLHAWQIVVAATNAVKEKDPVFSVSVAAGITQGDVNDWDAAYGWGNHQLMGYLTNEADPQVDDNMAPNAVSRWRGTNLTGGSIYNLDNGNVGIGITNPGSLLHVKSASGNVVVTADRDSAAVAAQFVLAQGATARWLLVDRDSGALVGTQTRRFDIYDGIAASPRLSVDNSGNVGIGTPNPAYKLDVDGSANINGPLSVAGILRVTETNIIEVMGTNIITNWPHRSQVTNLNADMVDGLHAWQIVVAATNAVMEKDPVFSASVAAGITQGDVNDWDAAYGWGNHRLMGYLTNEVDPQVDDNILNNYIPRWNSAIKQLVTGSIYNDPNSGNIGIGTTSPDQTLDIEAYSPLLGFTRNAPSGGFIGGQCFVNYGGGVAFWAGGNGADSSYSSYSIRAGDHNGILGLAVDPSGRVGIGTPTPGSLLHVKSASGNVVVTADRDSAAMAAQFVLAQGATARWLLVDRDSGALVGTQTRRFDIYDGIAASPRLSVDNSGNVGIGTPNPEHKLDVNGNIRASCYFDRNDINYYLNPNGDSRLANTYLSYIRNYGNLHVDGNVGIGTASPARLLDVRSTGTSYLTIRGNNAGGNAAILEFYDTTSAHNWQIGMGDTSLDNDLKFYKGTDGLAGSELMRVTDTGNVGIGTPSPNAGLDISRAGAWGSLVIRNSYVGGNTHFDYPDGKNYIRGTTIIADSSGNVGIGTTSPGYKLDVNGNGRYNGSVYIEGGNFLRLWGSGASPGNATLQYMGSGDGAYVRLEAGDSAAWRPVALAPSGGNVGIGTPSPAAKLDVNGNAIVRGPLYLSASDCRIQAGVGAGLPFLALTSYQSGNQGGRYTTVLTTPDGGFMVAGIGQSVPNLHVRNDGWVIAKSGFYPLSDDRIKINEQQLESGLAQVMALVPKRYDRIEYDFDPETEELVFYPEKISRTNEIGLVAQDVQQVIPEAVGIPEDENRDLWKISYDTIVPVLVKAIQEQQGQIELLKQRIETLERR